MLAEPLQARAVSFLSSIRLGTTPPSSPDESKQLANVIAPTGIATSGSGAHGAAPSRTASLAEAEGIDFLTRRRLEVARAFLSSIQLTHSAPAEGQPGGAAGEDLRSTPVPGPEDAEGGEAGPGQPLSPEMEPLFQSTAEKIGPWIRKREPLMWALLRQGCRIFVSPSKGSLPVLGYSVLRYDPEEEEKRLRRQSATLYVSQNTQLIGKEGDMESSLSGASLAKRKSNKGVSFGFLLKSSWTPRRRLRRGPEAEAEGEDEAEEDGAGEGEGEGEGEGYGDADADADEKGEVEEAGEEGAGAAGEEYDALFLDDPEIRSGKHRTVMNLPGFMESIIPYVRPKDLRGELNRQFASKHSWLPPAMTLSKIRNLKLDLVRILIDCDMDVTTLALAIVYFEKLVLKNLVSKPNRRLLADICFLLAMKFSEPKYPACAPAFFEAVSDVHGIPKKDLLRSEWAVFVDLNFSLHAPVRHVMPHFHRLSALAAIDTRPYHDPAPPTP
eukprot:tig00020902_g15055.t1